MGQPEEEAKPVSRDTRGRILAFADLLAEPQLSSETRLAIAAQIRQALLGETNTPVPGLRLPFEHPPPEGIHSVAV